MCLINLLRKLDFNIRWHKVVGPTQRNTFLGVDIDTHNSTLSLGNDKLQQLGQRLQQFQNKRRATKHLTLNQALQYSSVIQKCRTKSLFL